MHLVGVLSKEKRCFALLNMTTNLQAGRLRSDRNCKREEADMVYTAQFAKQYLKALYCNDKMLTINEF